jgi:dihydroxyacetone kinase DhaKLM complex PTS-EIIA-like component DhaM
MQNINQKTGIAYGYISARALQPDMVNDLMTGMGVENFRNISEEAMIADIAAKHRRDTAAIAPAFLDLNGGLSDDEIVDALLANDLLNYEDLICEEPVIEGTYEGVRYVSSWLGGALNFFIVDSPVITSMAAKASPCVPGAGILDDLDGNVTAYDVPLHWRENQMVRVW